MLSVTRHRIERLNDSNATEYYTLFSGRDDWTRDQLDAVEFSTFARASNRAERVGGEVVGFSRPATAYEAAMIARPAHIYLQAAE